MLFLQHVVTIFLAAIGLVIVLPWLLSRGCYHVIKVESSSMYIQGLIPRNQSLEWSDLVYVLPLIRCIFNTCILGNLILHAYLFADFSIIFSRVPIFSRILVAPDKDWKQYGIYPPHFCLIGYFNLVFQIFVLGIHLKAYK